MRRPAWCSSCGKAFQAKSRKQSECAACLDGPEPDESAGDLPAVMPQDQELVERFMRSEDPAQAPADEVECPRCAERIKARAKVCKHCGWESGEKPKRRSERLARDDSRSREAPGSKPRSPLIWVLLVVVAAVVVALYLEHALREEKTKTTIDEVREDRLRAEEIDTARKLTEAVDADRAARESLKRKMEAIEKSGRENGR